MAGEWKELPFSEAVLLNPATPLGRGTVYPFVDMSAITAGTRDVKCSEHREFTGGGSRFQDRDTLMARITPCLENGKMARFQAPEGEPVGHGSTEFIVIRGRQNITVNDYAYYLTISPEVRSFAISQMTGTSGRQRVPTDALGGIAVPVPPLAEQKAIAAVLGALDDKIELNQRMNATLEAMARALFQSWFVDFDPVRAKLDGRKPIGLDETTAALFPDSFQDSSLGHIPKGWNVRTLSDITSLITKGTTPTQDDTAGAPDPDAQINYVRVNSIDEDGSVLADKLTTIPESVHAGVLKRSILMTNDVLYTIAGTIGRIALAEDWLLPANTNQAVAIIRPEPEIPSGFLILTMRHEVFREELHNNIVQAVQANLSLGMLSKARVVVPPQSILQQLFRPIDALLSQISANRAQSRTLATLRDTLLPKLLSGELSVS